MKKIVNPWIGLEGYDCFGCAPENPCGLHMEFYEDEDDIVAYWKPNGHFQGWLNTLHGGVIASIMDEIAGWVVFRKLQTSGVTTKMEVRYLKSIPTDEPKLTVRGRIKNQKRNAVFLETEIYNSQDELCAKAEMVYFVMPSDVARDKYHFIPCEIENENK